ncbi:MAG: LysE family transporter [Promethearchaeota archaeon]
MALTGAMSPGPLLTYTIYNAIKAKKRGYRVGILVILGHAILEFVLLLGLVYGAGAILSDPIATKVIGLFGGTLLVYFGYSLMNDILRKRIDFSFLKGTESPTTEEGLIENNMSSSSQLSEEPKKKAKKDQNKLLNMHPILGGIVISLSNPYWILWWATWGLNAMVLFSINSSNIPGLLIFFFGHEMGDIIWYVPIATLVGLSSKIMTKKVYTIILVACGIFMIIFGLYLAISPFL